VNLLAIDMSPANSGGPVNDKMQFVYAWIFWGSMILGIIVGGLLLWSFFRFRRKTDDEEPQQVHGNTRLEITWTAIPFAILFMLFIVTAVNMPYINDQRPASDHPLLVNVEGQQFQWAMTYNPGPGQCQSCSKQVKTTNVLIVPVNTPVNIDLTSHDVNHSLYLPNLGGQMNALPGQTNHMWIQASRSGVFYGQCTELCGYGHKSMVIAVIALDPPQFNTCINGKGPLDLQDISTGKNKDCAPPNGGF
jgi:cytochrome c oxidase subunit 2